MNLRTRLTKLERTANRPAPDYRAILMGVAEQVPLADRSLILESLAAWEGGDEEQLHRFVREIGDEALDLVCSAFDRAGLVARRDSGFIASILSRTADDPSLDDSGRAAAREMARDVQSGKIHRDDVLPRLSDELLTAFERALHHPKTLSGAIQSET